MKKALSIILALVMILSVTVIGFAEEEKETLNYLLLGDSIARGSGVLNHDEACFGRIVADTNGYNYKNRGIDGFTTANLVNELNKSDVIRDVAEADIISISIGGNDFLGKTIFLNMIKLVIEAAFGNLEPSKQIVESAYDNFCIIIGKIKEINPEATILFQTLYAPNYPLVGAQLERIITLLNEKLVSYLDENPEAFTVVDVHAALKGVFGFTALDTIHPNAKGNVLIAREVLKVLKELGLGEATEPVINHPGVNEIALPIWPILQLFV